jgi:pyruvate dehydrogenase E2 component (dihydrolipoamide acetyltransferase)
MAKVILPELGEDIKSAVLSYWHFGEGETVEEGEDLVELSTDKATFNIPAPASGRITKVFFEEGATVNVGDTLAVIE